MLVQVGSFIYFLYLRISKYLYCSTYTNSLYLQQLIALRLLTFLKTSCIITIMSQKNLIGELAELDEKQTPSDKIVNTVGLISSIIATAVLLFCLLLYFIQEEVSLYMWLYAFYPLVICIICGIACSVAELIRNRYLVTIAACVLGILSAVTVITVLIVQGVLYHQVFIIPFYFL